MNFIKIFIILILLSFSSQAKANYFQEVIESYERAINGDESLFGLDADLNIVSVDRNYNGIETIEIDSESIYLLSGKIKFLPESLNLSLSYSQNLNNILGSSDRKTNYLDTGINIYSNDYFYSRFERYDHRFTSIIKNKNNFPIVVEDKHGNHGIDPNFGYDIADLEYIPPNGEFKTNDSYYTRNSIRVVSNYDVTENFGFSYALEEGSKPHPYEVPGQTYVFVDVEQKGSRLAVGYYKDDATDKYYISKFEVYQRNFTRYYDNKYICSQNFYDDIEFINNVILLNG